MKIVYKIDFEMKQKIDFHLNIYRLEIGENIEDLNDQEYYQMNEKSEKVKIKIEFYGILNEKRIIYDKIEKELNIYRHEEIEFEYELKESFLDYYLEIENKKIPIPKIENKIKEKRQVYDILYENELLCQVIMNNEYYYGDEMIIYFKKIKIPNIKGEIKEKNKMITSFDHNTNYLENDQWIWSIPNEMNEKEIIIHFYFNQIKYQIPIYLFLKNKNYQFLFYFFLLLIKYTPPFPLKYKFLVNVITL